MKKGSYANKDCHGINLEAIKEWLEDIFSKAGVIRNIHIRVKREWKDDLIKLHETEKHDFYMADWDEYKPYDGEEW